MKAWVVREERHGRPRQAMRLEAVDPPALGPREVLVRVMAAGINYNHVWACFGKPAPVSRLHRGDPTHIGGSDCAGVVEAVGADVRGWKPGDEVVTHPAITCGECAACLGFESSACLQAKAWGYETSWGSFAEYCKVASTQLLPKPKRLSWEEAACYGLKLFTAYRMLVVRCELKPGDRVLIWGAAGGLGSYAIRLCRAVNAIPICVVSSARKAAYCRSLGAELMVDRTEFPYLNGGGADPERLDGVRAFGKRLKEVTGGYSPDVVFEHSGRATFPTSVFVARRQGKIVICGATTGYDLGFDARFLWLHEKSIVGSHGCNLHDATRANLLVDNGVVEPTLTRSFAFEEAAEAHELLLDNEHTGSWIVRVGCDR